VNHSCQVLDVQFVYFFDETKVDPNSFGLKCEGQTTKKLDELLMEKKKGQTYWKPRGCVQALALRTKVRSSVGDLTARTFAVCSAPLSKYCSVRFEVFTAVTM
jgi:hypothetical protein